MDQMRMDPKHQFAAQYVLSRAANERREREALLAAAVNMSHFAMSSANMQPILGGGGGGGGGHGGGGLNCSPTGGGGVAGGIHSDPGTRISTPAEMKMEHGGGGGSLRSPFQVNTNFDIGFSKSSDINCILEITVSNVKFCFNAVSSRSLQV
jgi:hypothetical protein